MFFAVAAYSLALPVGVMVTSLFGNLIDSRVAVIATSVALGSLFGCMVFDFLLPAIAQIKKRRLELGWVVLGLILTELLIKL